MNHLKTAMFVMGVLIVALTILLVGCKSSETTKKPTKKPTEKPTDASVKPDTDKTKKLSFQSFEGGGYDYSVTIDDESVATCSATTEYEGDKNAKGASYEYVITVKAVAPGETGMTIYGQSDLLGEVYHYYRITVEDDLMLTLEEIDAPYGVTGPAATNGGDNESRAVVKHSSFDGGGHEYSTVIDDESVATFTSKRDYGGQDPSEVDGASYDYVVTVQAVAPGETGMTITGDSPIMEPEVYYYKITVDADLKITLTELDEPYAGSHQDPGGSSPVTSETEDDMEPVCYPIVTIGDRSFPLKLEENSSAEAFLEKLKESGLLKLEMQDYGSFEKVADLPWELPANDESITTKPGDIILYQGNKITIYYDENTWEFTKLGHIDVEQDELKTLLGDGDVTVEFWLEWTE